MERINDPFGRKLLKLKYFGSIMGHGSDLLSRPLSAQLGRSGIVYIADRQTPPPNLPLAALVTGRIGAYDKTNGRFLFTFSETTPGHKLDLPSSIAINPKDGNVFVADYNKKAVYEFTPKGKFVRDIAAPAQTKGIWAPAAIAFDGKGNLYVVDVASVQRVIIFDGTGKVRTMFGGTGSAAVVSDKPGKFWYPAGIAVAANGWIFVSDSQNRRIQLFDENGRFQRIIDTGGLPRGIAIAPDNLLVVANLTDERFVIFDPDGRALQTYGEGGFKAGQFAGPNDISIDPKTAWVYVVDRDNNRVQVWGSK